MKERFEGRQRTYLRLVVPIIDKFKYMMPSERQKVEPLFFQRLRHLGAYILICCRRVLIKLSNSIKSKLQLHLEEQTSFCYACNISILISP